MEQNNTISPVVETTVENTSVVAENATVETVLPEIKVAEEVKLSPELKALLADDLKDIKSLGNFKDVNDLAKSYINLNSLLGKKVQDWSKENVDTFAVKMGRPEAVDGYTLPEELGDSSKEFKDFAFKAGLSQEQAKTLADEIILSNRAKLEKSKSDFEAFKTKAQTELKAEFGDAYEKRMSLATKAIVEVGGEALLKAINDSGLGMNTELIKGFSKLGVDYFEADRTVKADRTGLFGITPGEAKAMLDAKQADPEFRARLYSRTHPGHNEAVKEIQMLIEKLGQKQ